MSNSRICSTDSFGLHTLDKTSIKQKIYYEEQQGWLIKELRNHSYIYTQRLRDLKFINLVQRRLRDQLLEVFKYLTDEFTRAFPRGLFDYDLNDKTKNNGAKLIVKRFNASVTQYFYPINITTCNALPNEVVSNRTVKSFKNCLDKHWEETPLMYELIGCDHRCLAS